MPASFLTFVAAVFYQDDESCAEAAQTMAEQSRREARKLMSLTYAVRKSILNAVADAIIDRKADILQANELDLTAAAENKTAAPLVMA